jgi:hypothetical protein
MLHFAYGSNMSRALMRRCPSARAVGPAVLEGHRFVITRDGYASVVRCPGARVHGLLWRLGPRDLAARHHYEGVASGLYRPVMRPVRCEGRSVPALVYIGRARGEGRPRPGYQALVVAAARDLNLPAGYVDSLARWAPRCIGARAKDTGELAWPAKSASSAM